MRRRVRRRRPEDLPEALFVYGTLKVGHCRWPILEPFVHGGATGLTEATVPGRLYDTGLDYPAARFDHDGTIRGQVGRLVADRMQEALEVLDEVEGAVVGEYRRVVVVTRDGERAWAYEFGGSAAGLPDLDGVWEGA